MIASIYRLSRQDLKELRITDEYSIHRVVYDLFPESKVKEQGDATKNRGFLFVDKGGDFSNRTILILSDRNPCVPAVGSIQSKLVPAKFLSHKAYAFEVVMNPTKRDVKTGKTVAIRGVEHLRTWMIHKSPEWGFRIAEDRLEVRNVGVRNFKNKNGSTITQNTATYKGILKVIDSDLFVRSFETGIGRGKAFGFGLLQLVPISE